MITKFKKSFALLTTLFSLAACGKTEVVTVTVETDMQQPVDGGAKQIGYYDETDVDPVTGRTIFNNNLFYRNDYTIPGADPGVFRVTDPTDPDYGMFYCYATIQTGQFIAYASPDLTTWDGRGVVINSTTKGDDYRKVLYSDLWAPEVIFDEDTGKYYMFFSATPYDTDYTDQTQSYLRTEPFIAVADSPRGPFSLIEHNDYLDYDGQPLSGGKRIMRYSMFDPYQMYAAAKRLGLEDLDKEAFHYFRSIDFHPWVDPTDGTKYLYIKREKSQHHSIFVMTMIDNEWDHPDYDSLVRLTRPRYYTVDDTSIENYNPVEAATYCNEGPWMDYHNGKYYLTVSINAYTDRSYSVIQAVSDSPMGPFRKLTEDEGGILLSTDSQTRDDISGPGHHSNIEVDGKLYIVYHVHDSIQKGGGSRHVVADEIKWITIKDKFGEDLDIMYVNGPTHSIQPRFEFASDYVNIAGEATIEATNLDPESSVKWLNDDLLTMTNNVNVAMVNEYVKESEFTDSTKITLTFDEDKPMKSLMVYNSKNMSSAFTKVKKATFYSKDGSVSYLDDLKFDFYANTSADDEDVIRPGCAAIAEFDTLNAYKVELDIDPATEDEIFVHGEDGVQLAISEIKVLAEKAK